LKKNGPGLEFNFWDDMVQYTLTEALAKRKLIQKKIEDLIERVRFEEIKPKGENTTDLERQIKRVYQSIEDQFRFLERLNATISQTNATTRVNICGKEYTIAEAISKKEIMNLRGKFIGKLREDHTRAAQIRASKEQDNERRLDELMSRGTIGSRSSKDFNVANDMEQLSETFRNMNAVKNVDPVGLTETIPKMLDELDNFKNEVDFRLSEINSITRIEVQDN